MNEAIHHIRAKIFTVLNGNITLNGSNVDVYNRVPSNASHPYIWIYSLSTNEVNQNASKFNLECITRIECTTRFDADTGGDLDSNLLVNSVVSLLRTRSAGYFDLSSSNFKVYTSEVVSINYLQDDAGDHTYIKGIIELSNKVEQTN